MVGRLAGGYLCWPPQPVRLQVSSVQLLIELCCLCCAAVHCCLQVQAAAVAAAAAFCGPALPRRALQSQPGADHGGGH